MKRENRQARRARTHALPVPSVEGGRRWDRLSYGGRKGRSAERWLWRHGVNARAAGNDHVRHPTNGLDVLSTQHGRRASREPR